MIKEEISSNIEESEAIDTVVTYLYTHHGSYGRTARILPVSSQKNRRQAYQEDWDRSARLGSFPLLLCTLDVVSNVLILSAHTHSPLLSRNGSTAPFVFPSIQAWKLPQKRSMNVEPKYSFITPKGYRRLTIQKKKVSLDTGPCQLSFATELLCM